MRTSISRPCPRFAARPERRAAMLLRNHRIRNPLPAPQPGLLGRDRDLLPARLRPHRERERQHRNARRRSTKMRPTRSPSRPRSSRFSICSSSPPSSPTRSSATTPAASRRSSARPRSPTRQIVLGRFLGGLIIAWLGYLAVPLGHVRSARSMPWVDPETVGPAEASLITPGISRSSRSPTSS